MSESDRWMNCNAKGFGMPSNVDEESPSRFGARWTSPRNKAEVGRFFEDFVHGEIIRHTPPRTVTVGDATLYAALYGCRFAPQSSAPLAQALNYDTTPLDDLLVFNIVLGMSAPDISRNAVFFDLGYAGGRFLAPVYPGDTVTAVSEVIGLRENDDRRAGVVYVRTGESAARAARSDVARGDCAGCAWRRRADFRSERLEPGVR